MGLQNAFTALPWQSLKKILHLEEIKHLLCYWDTTLHSQQLCYFSYNCSNTYHSNGWWHWV